MNTQKENTEMLVEPTIEKLKLLRLIAMASAWLEQQKRAEMNQLAFDERFGLLVDAEWLNRENRRLARSLKEAKLKLSQACVEDIDYSPRRELDRAVIRQLATCRWVDEHQNVVITGMTGTGKTYLACALAQQACRKGFRALYRRVSRLLDELTLARADGSYVRLLGKLARADVLILDDWGMTPLRDQDRRDLHEVLDDRYATRSTIVTSQLPVSKWHDYLGDPSSADAICDRMIHNAHRIMLKGPSRRKEKSEDNKPENN
jgi:DNA replication protein DnaC